MSKIYFAPNWGMTSEDMLTFYNKQTKNKSGSWNKLSGTTDKESADYIVVQDDTAESVDINKVIFLGREPDHILPKRNSLKWENCHIFLHHAFNTAWLPQTWWVDIDYDALTASPPEKDKMFSIIDSGRSAYNGHKARLTVIQQFLQKHSGNVDVWGRITEGREGTGPFKTSLPDRQKEAGLLPYKYSLAIENGSTESYFSEKLIDPLLCWCMPIYFGCSNMSSFLPEGSFINIDIDSNTVADDINDIIHSDYRECNLDKIAKAREMVYNKYNIWPTIELAIEKRAQ